MGRRETGEKASIKNGLASRQLRRTAADDDVDGSFCRDG